MPDLSLPANGLHRSESIQALRGLASLAVAWFHLTGNLQSVIGDTGSFGWLGVKVFFVISGFVIPISIITSDRAYSIMGFPRFMARRIIRIEPPYLLSVVLVIILLELSQRAPGFAGAPYQFDLLGFLAHIAYLIPLTNHGWLQPVYWTLAYEFAFYLFVGLFFPLINGDRRIWLGLLTAVVGAVLFGLPADWLLFAIGIVTYRAKTGIDTPYLTLVLVVVIVAVMNYVGLELESIVGLGTATLIYLFYNLEIRGLFGRALLWLGTISYSLYLVHVPIGVRVVNVGRRYISTDWPAELALAIIALGVAVAAATIFYRLVEMPAFRASRKFA